MSARLVVSRRAHQDLLEILRQLTQVAGWRVAQAYGERFLRLYELICERPEICAARPKLGPFARVGVVHPYLVIYRHIPGEDVVGLIRILHGRRKLSRRLLG